MMLKVFFFYEYECMSLCACGEDGIRVDNYACNEVKFKM